MEQVVRRRSVGEIEELALQVRLTIGLDVGDRVSMMDVLENVMPVLLGVEGYAFIVKEDRYMQGVEAVTQPIKPVICFKASTYRRLQMADPHARFTAAHELAHALMHSGAHVHYAQASRHRSKETDPEWQANAFAAAFLMPAPAFRSCMTIDEAIVRFGVGFDAALTRARVLGHRFIRPPSKKKGSRHMPTPLR